MGRSRPLAAGSRANPVKAAAATGKVSEGQAAGKEGKVASGKIPATLLAAARKP